MNKKVFGLIISALAIGGMVAFMVKTNLDKPEPLEVVAPIAEEGENDPFANVGLKKGELPPDFELTTLAGDTVRLSDLKGKKVLLNFWASWCGPCKAEMPHMQDYYRNNKEEDFEMIAVNLTTEERNGREGIQDFVDAYGLTFPIPLDEEGEVAKGYKIISIPTTYMLDREGKVAQKIIGPMDVSVMSTLVDAID